MKKTIFKIIFVYLFILSAPTEVYSLGSPTHLDRTKLPSGCFSCHAAGHGIKGTALLKSGNSVVCLGCHDKNSKIKNIDITHEDDITAVLNKDSRHPVIETASLHKVGENFPEKIRGAKRHVACEDCHEVHSSTKRKPLERVAGLNSFGAPRLPASAEYEICYKCHADSANLPQNEKNKRLEFNGNNLSFHPVEARGKSSRVPSLIRPMTESTIITCSDCHGNDDPSGPKGPHGSIYAPILVEHYETQDGLQENNYEYALCYKCHDRSSILRDQSFSFHNLHIIKVRASCYACHNSHGSQLNTHLINFNPEVLELSTKMPTPQPVFSKQQSSPNLPAFPSPSQLPFGIGMGRYVDFRNGHGQCFLSCHGKVHNPLGY